MASDLIQQVIDRHKGLSSNAQPPPSLIWHPEEWLEDARVLLMSMEARGIHFHLMMLAWKDTGIGKKGIPCSVPDDPVLLRAACFRPESWERSWPEVRRAWEAHEGRLWHLGLCRHYLDSMARRQRRSVAGKRAAVARWQGRDAKRMRNACDPHDAPKACESHEKRVPIACDSQNSKEANRIDSDGIRSPSDTNRMEVDAMGTEIDAMASGEDANGISSRSSSLYISSSYSSNREKKGGVQRGKTQTALPADIESLAVPEAQRREIAHLVNHPSEIDVESHRARKLTDAGAAQVERVHLLAELVHRTGEAVASRSRCGRGDETALDLWNVWRDRRKAKARAEKKPWFSEVRTLRSLLGGDHSPGQILEALLKAGDAGWRGFDWKWLEGTGANGACAAVTGAAGYLPPQDDGINV